MLAAKKTVHVVRFDMKCVWYLVQIVRSSSSRRDNSRREVQKG